MITKTGVPPRKALAIRPYGDRIRRLVFAHLQAAQLDVEAPAELLEASNEEIARSLHRYRADVLLIPFHATSIDGRRTNGLELLTILRENVSWTRRVPVLMPVSVFAAVAFQAKFAEGYERLLPIYEEELTNDSLAPRIAEFVQPTLQKRLAPTA